MKAQNPAFETCLNALCQGPAVKMAQDLAMKVAPVGYVETEAVKSSLRHAMPHFESNKKAPNDVLMGWSVYWVL